MAKQNAYDIVNARILELLEKGVIPWKRTWDEAANLPRNLTSGHFYRGANMWLLGSAGYASPLWATFSQIKKLGGMVKSGETGWPIVLWKFFDVKDEESGVKKTVPYVRYWTVFNVDQTAGLPEDKIPKIEKIERRNDIIDFAQNIVNNMENPPKIQDGIKACYYPALDKIQMPKLETFHSSEDYYSVTFHELGHSTGHVSRLNRRDVTETDFFGSTTYGREELVAELCAAYLCYHCHINPIVEENTASYIQSWMKKIKAEPKLFVWASSRAQKAAEYICPELKPPSFKDNDTSDDE